MKRMTIGELKGIIDYLKDDVIVEITDDIKAIVAVNENGGWHGVELELKSEDMAGVLNFEDTTTNIPCGNECLPSKESIKDELRKQQCQYIYRVRDVTLRHPSIDDSNRKEILKHVNQLPEIISICLNRIDEDEGYINVDINWLKSKHDTIYSEIDKFAIPGGEKEFRRLKSRINVLNDIMNDILRSIDYYGTVCELERDGKKVNED